MWDFPKFWHAKIAEAGLVRHTAPSNLYRIVILAVMMVGILSVVKMFICLLDSETSKCWRKKRLFICCRVNYVPNHVPRSQKKIIKEWPLRNHQFSNIEMCSRKLFLKLRVLKGRNYIFDEKVKQIHSLHFCWN